jgi:hypothetical protein
LVTKNFDMLLNVPTKNYFFSRNIFSYDGFDFAKFVCEVPLKLIIEILCLYVVSKWSDIKFLKECIL